MLSYDDVRMVVCRDCGGWNVKMTTFGNGSLGSRDDEVRSGIRKLVYQTGIVNHLVFECTLHSRVVPSGAVSRVCLFQHHQCGSQWGMNSDRTFIGEDGGFGTGVCSPENTAGRMGR